MDSREAVDIDLSRYLEKLRRHWLPAASIFSVTVVLACLSTFFVKPSYVAEGKLRFKVDQTPFLTGIDEEAGELRPLVATQNPLSTEIEVIYAKPLLQKMIDVLELTDAQGKGLRPKDVLKNLNVSIIGGTDVLKLSYESNQPQEAANVVNMLMRFYIYGDIQNQRSRALSARQFIAEQLPQRETVVRETEEALSQFKRKHNIIDLEVEDEATVNAISKLESEITTVQSELEEAIARSTTLRNQVGLSPQEAITVSKLSQSSEIKEILRELQSVERQLVTARKDYQDKFPTVISLKARQSALKNLLNQKSQKTIRKQSPAKTVRVELDDPQQSSIKDFLAAEVQRRAIAKRLESLKRRRSAYDRRTQALPKLRQTLRELERKSKAAQSTYETLLKKLQELQVAENTNASNAQIIEHALVPTEGTTFRKKAIIVAFGILLGSFLATASIPILAMRQQRFLKSQKDVENIFGYPVWSVIPPIEDKDTVDKHGSNALISIVGEMHRMIQDHPQLLSADQTLKTIVVTSPESGEGKSTISANLAVTMAQLGQRVLLVDANMHNPQQHHLFKLPNELGLSNVIRDTSIRFPEVQMIINQVMNNFDVLTSGTKPASPISILCCERMTLLLQYFAWNYDFVILDASPLLYVDGTSALGNMADGVLLVTNPAAIGAEDIAMVKEIITRSEQNVIGMVINRAATEKSSATNVSNSTMDFSENLLERLDLTEPKR